MTPKPSAPAQAGLGRIDHPVFAAFAITGLVGIAWIHILDLGEKLDEAPYVGAAYLVLIAGCIAAAVMLARRNYFGFVLGGRLAAATFIAYNISRTVGLPGATGDINNWFEPLGVWSLITEGAVVAV
jgi:hypothetical protein